MGELLKYRIGTASKEEIYSHLKACDNDFKPPLNQRVNISEYSQKLHELSTTFEAWAGNDLVGLVAAYFNNPLNHSAYITSVSTKQPYQSRGIATELLKKCIDYARENNYKVVILDVDASNRRAQLTYEKLNFRTLSQGENVTTMECDLRSH